ncbi:MAG: MBL fold metallo-hydrolase [Deltaproteobacteria bacterium]|nr:MBL fold metallo-hydrolase [Deltaproteobacteria bacterium]
MRLGISRGVLLAALALWPTSAGAEIPEPLPHVNPRLAAHQAQFAEPKLMRLSKHVYAAVGYDLANVGFVVTDAGVLVFDTGGELERAKKTLAALREVSKAPIVGVVYSHGHGDHVGGVKAYVPEGHASGIPIYANARYRRYLREMAIPRGMSRGYFQMGYLLPRGPAGSIGAGAGPAVGSGRLTYLTPSVEIEDALELTLGGVRIRLFHAPGDLDDSLSAWLPDEGVLMAGDSAYPMMPAISTPRSEYGRRVWEALDTLDSYRALPVEQLLTGHLRVISGREEVYDFLTKFRDTIQFLNDQTLRAVNQQLDHGEAARLVEATLPQHLATDPDLGEYYHELEWTLKGLYTKAVGWWNGDVVDLVEVPRVERFERTIALAGGREKVREAAHAAFAAGERAWSAQLMRMLVATQSDDAASRRDLARILRTIAYDANTANTRHYLLSQALVLEGKLDLAQLPISRANPEFLRANPDSVLFRSLGPRVDPVKSRDVVLTVGFRIRDTGAQHTVFVRRGVIEHRAGRPERADLRVEFDRETWIQLAAGMQRWLDAHAAGSLRAEPDREALERFASIFDGQVE